MLKKLLVVAGFAMAVAFSTGVAHADTITGTTTGPSCPNCPAATYSLTVSGDLSSGTNLTVTLTIDFTGSPTSADDLISAVAFKIGNNALSAGTLVGPGTFTTSDLNSGINNSGCSGDGSGFICSAGSVGVSQGTTLTWTWTGVNMGGPVSTNPADWTIKVDYGPNNGYIISDSLNGTKVPEPGTLVLLGFGLIPLFGFGRRFLA